MITICRTCATQRSIKSADILTPSKCDLCDTRAMTFDINATELKSSDIAFEKGYLVSDDVSKSLALIKSRKAVLAPRIKQLQIQLSRPMEQVRYQEALRQISDNATQGLNKRSLDTCKAVLSGINELVSGTDVSTNNQATLKVIMQNLMGEMSGLEQKEKQFSILYNSCIDKILITELRAEIGSDRFNEVYQRAKKIYNKKQ